MALNWVWTATVELQDIVIYQYVNRQRLSYGKMLESDKTPRYHGQAKPILDLGVLVSRHPISEMARAWVVYRLYSESGRLLYVGATSSIQVRLRKHQRRAWWQDVATYEVEHHPDPKSCRIAERMAIRNEAPVHNVAGADR